MTAFRASIHSLSGFVFHRRQRIAGRICRLLILLTALSSLAFAQNTTIRGTVYMPNGTLPLPNVLVYVTTGSVTLPAAGANCTSGSVTAAEGCITAATITPTVVTSGEGVYAYTTTAVDGTFTLSNVPEGSSYTLVIQSGKWLNEFTEPSSGTLAGPLSGLQLSMPTAHSATANIPLIAIETGSQDALECVFRDIGVATTEFTDDSVTSGSSYGGRIHLYKGNGAEMSSSTPAGSTLLTQSKLNGYDMVMFPCEGGTNPGASSTTIPYLINYASQGGRVFATHNSDAWLDTTDTGANGDYFYSTGGSTPMTWGSAANSVTPDPGYAVINTNFSDGSWLSQWLYENGYSYGASGDNTGTEDEVEISTLRLNVNAVNAPAQAWLTYPAQGETYSSYNSGDPIMQFSFNTPWGASASDQYGRVLYNEYHVEAVTESGNPTFPNECPTLSGASQVPQEKMLEYAIFDLSAAVIPVVLPTASISITTDPEDAVFKEGDTGDAVTVNVTNTSSTVALPNNLTLAITLPDGLTATAMVDSSSGNWVCTVGSLTCTNTSGIAPSASDAITITVSIAGNATGNSTTVSSSVSATLSSPNFSSGVTSPLTITLESHAAVTWATPTAIDAGTPLSSTQLDAVGNTPGTYVYTLGTTSGTVVTSGTVLPAGSNTLWVTFTPSDQDMYPGTATASVVLVVNSATATAANPAPVSLGSTPVGTPISENVTFTFTGAGTIGTPIVVTQGVAGLDYTDAGTGTCDTNGTSYNYSVSGTCTVAVQFSPLYPGLRYGAVLLEDGSGNVLATAYLSGIGTGSEALFPPGTQTMLTPDLYTYWPEAMAVDANSDVFFIDGNSNSYQGAIIEFPWQGSSYGAALAPSTLNLPGNPYEATGALAVDGAGNLFVGINNYETSTGSILEYPWNGTSYGTAISLGSGLINPTGIAIDGSGSLFIADDIAQLIAELPWTGSGYGSQVTLADSTSLGYGEPIALAIDSSENVFFLDNMGGPIGLLEMPYVSSEYSTSFVTLDGSLYNPSGIAIDTNNNAYVPDANPSGSSAPVYEYRLTGGTYAARTQLFTIPSTPYSGGAPISLDGAGNIYLDWNSGDGGGAVYKQNRNVLPSVTFPTSTPEDTADTTDNPLSFAVLNYGNASLAFTSSSSHTNPSFSGGGGSFALDGSTTCPNMPVNGSVLVLGANVTCSYGVDFTPQSAESITGLVVLTDNNLNGTAVTQPVSLGGTGTAPSVTISSPESTTLTAGTVASAYGGVAFASSGGTSPYTYAVISGSIPAGMTLSAAGVLSGTPTAGGVFSFTVRTTDDNSFTGSQTYSLTINPPTIVVTPSAETLTSGTVGSSFSQTFGASGGTSTYTYSYTGTLPAGLTLSSAGILSGTPTAAGGPYSFTVVATDSSTGTGPYTGNTVYSLTILKATAPVTLGNLAQTYTGSPLSATATTVPSGLTVTFTYNSSETAPTAAGNYTVVATINDPNYQGSATGTLVISKATAPVTLGNLAQTYTGSPLSATATTVPSGLTVTFTYNSSETAPTAAGNYTVVAAINDPNYQGSATGTLVISKATAPVTLGNLAQTYTGSPLSATATTVPSGLTVTFTYNSSETAPTAAGNYTVVAAINDPNYQGSATGTLVISKATAPVTLGNLAQTYTGSPLSATATTVPSGLTVTFTYNGGETAPTAAGSYTVVATISNPNYQGSTTGTLVISKATAPVTLGNLAQTYTGSPLSATATTVPSGLTVTFTYNGGETAPTAAGSYTVVATISNPNYQGSTTGTLVISNATATVTLGGLSQAYTGSPLSATATTVPSGLTVTFTYNGSATAPTAAGRYTVVATVATGDYAGSATGTMTISQLTPTVSLTSGSNPAVTESAVTFTAIMHSTIGTPTGTVTFLDGTTSLGQGTLSAGAATLTTSSLSDGAHSITAVYNGDTNFVTATSAALSQTILDFNLTPGSGTGSGSGSGSGSSVTTQTVSPGGTANYPLDILPTNGAIFPAPITLSVTGLPTGATAVISPTSWSQLTSTTWSFPANTALPTITLAVQLPTTVASVKGEDLPTRKSAPIFWGMLLLPFAFRLRRAGKRLSRIVSALLITAVGLAAMSALSGCSTGNGFFGQQQSSYTITVTATSGPLVRSTNLTLNVE